MTTPTALPATILIATTPEWDQAATSLEGAGFLVVRAESGVAALGRARVVRPDAIILSSDLPDMSGIEACRLLHADPLVGGNVPVVILTAETPSPAQRVSGLSAGVWDFFRHPRDDRELSLKLQTYVEARRNATAAIADGGMDPASGLHARPALARRARELGGLMTRMHGGLSCLVFETTHPDPAAPALVAQITRVSDVVGILGPSQFAVLAPATSATGATALARRVATALKVVGGNGDDRSGMSLQIGYDAVDNLTYTPIHPPDLIARATAAVRAGRPEAASNWIRRFDAAAAEIARAPATAGPALDRRGS